MQSKLFGGERGHKLRLPPTHTHTHTHTHTQFPQHHPPLRCLQCMIPEVSCKGLTPLGEKWYIYVTFCYMFWSNFTSKCYAFLFVLASYTGSHVWARKKEPDTHCLHILSSSEFLEISIKSALLH